jgi:cellobiose phosphorylase
MYQTAIGALLGLQRRGCAFAIDPCIPAMWPGYTMDWRIGRTRYHIVVANPEHRCRDVRSAMLDGQTVDARAIPLVDDGDTHEVTIELGKAVVPDFTPPVPF